MPGAHGVTVRINVYTLTAVWIDPATNWCRLILSICVYLDLPGHWAFSVIEAQYHASHCTISSFHTAKGVIFDLKLGFSTVLQ